MPLCCWSWKGFKCGSLEAKESPEGTPEKIQAPPPEIKVFEAPEYGNGNPRNKCALQPGHSLMDWIRFGNSGKDLAGTGGRLRPVTPGELAAHNQQDNAWIAIRGKVYNIVDYLDYHPGGPDELMRGAGKDATQLFDQVHAWVNYESLLSKCLIGPLKQPQISDEEYNSLFGSNQSTPKSQGKKELRKSMESLKSSGAAVSSKDSISDSDLAGNKSSSESSLNANEERPSNKTQVGDSSVKTGVQLIGAEPKKILSESSKFKYPTLVLTKADSIKSDSSDAEGSGRNESKAATKVASPKFDWIQKTDSITLIFYTKSLCNPQSEVSISDDRTLLSATFSYDNYCFSFEIVFEEPVLWPCGLSVNWDTGKVEMVFKKENPKIWKNYGSTNKCSISELSIQIDENCSECLVIDKWEINHNTWIILLKYKNDRYISFPIGYHTRVFQNNEDMLSRSYTPVPPYLVPEFKPNNWSPNLLCLMVKKYEQGIISSWITSRNENDVVYVTKPMGSFCLKQLQDVSQLFLIAAGTGITPMLNLIQFSLQRRNPRCNKIDLLFFNRSEKDILWNDQLNMLSTKDDRFQVTNVLSDPSQTWQGLKGHINQALLKNHYSKAFMDQTSANDESMDTNKISKLVEQFLSEKNNIFYCICGPTPFTQLTKTLLTGLGCQETKLHCFLG